MIPIIDVCVCDHIVGHLDVCVHVVIVVIIVVTEDRKWKHFKIAKFSIQFMYNKPDTPALPGGVPWVGMSAWEVLRIQRISEWRVPCFSKKPTVLQIECTIFVIGLDN